MSEELANATSDCPLSPALLLLLLTPHSSLLSTHFSITMSPETALTELRDGLEIALWVGGPLLLVVLVVGVVVGVIQAATQLNEPTIAFVAKAIALTAALFATGS